MRKSDTRSNRLDFVGEEDEAEVAVVVVAVAASHEREGVANAGIGVASGVNSGAEVVVAV